MEGLQVSTFLNIEDSTLNGRINETISKDLEAKYRKVEKEADKTISSFANLVSELIKLKELSTGSQAKEQITKLTNELNNTSVFFTKMISDELGTLYKVINPAVTIEEITEEVTT